MSKLVAEAIGTALLVLLGDGVVANVLLAKTKGNNSGWIVITFGWAIGILVGVFVCARISGGHINPAVTLGFLINGSIDLGTAIQYWIGQFIGAFIGAVIVWLAYLPHFAETKDPLVKLAVFSTGPAIRNTVTNLICEIIGTFVLVFGVLVAFGGNAANSPGAGILGALWPALILLGIGLGLGGPTGYAVNPARDLGPRIAHFLLPIPGKGSSEWFYAWIPVVGPLIGGAIAALLYIALGRF